VEMGFTANFLPGTSCLTSRHMVCFNFCHGQWLLAEICASHRRDATVAGRAGLRLVSCFATVSLPSTLHFTCCRTSLLVAAMTPVDAFSL
jgi:hypothetical protein